MSYSTHDSQRLCTVAWARKNCSDNHLSQIFGVSHHSELGQCTGLTHVYQPGGDVKIPVCSQHLELIKSYVEMPSSPGERVQSLLGHIWHSRGQFNPNEAPSAQSKLDKYLSLIPKLNQDTARRIRRRDVALRNQEPE